MTDAEIAELRRREAEQEAADLAGFERGMATGRFWDVAMAAVGLGLSDAIPPMLHRQWRAGQVPTEALPEAIHAVWVHNRAPMAGQGERRWLELFKAAGFFWASEGLISDGQEVTPAFGHVRDAPTRPVEVWRGASVASRGRGMSWSVHRECARGFAEVVAAFGSEAAVWRAVVPGQAVLAAFGDDREQELVINPNMLRARVEVDEVLPARPLRPWPFGSATSST